jgi:hypothetical protein
MKQFLDSGGIHTPGLRFAFTNISDVEFVSAWGGNPIPVKSGETIELSDITPIPGAGMGHTLAQKMTTELVDRIIIGLVKADEDKVKAEKGDNYYRSPKSGSLGVPAMRKEWEDKILEELEPDTDSVQIRAIRNQLKETLINDAAKKEGVADEPLPKSVESFAQIDNEQREEVAKKPIKTKKIK